MGRPSRCSLYQEKISLVDTQGNLQPGMPGSNSERGVRSCDGLGSNIVVQNSVGPVITLHSRNTARYYMDMLGNEMHRAIQTLFLNNASIYTAGTVLSWLEEHEGELNTITRFQHH
jgi:hypothetical protein